MSCVQHFSQGTVGDLIDPLKTSVRLAYLNFISGALGAQRD